MPEEVFVLFASGLPLFLPDPAVCAVRVIRTCCTKYLPFPACSLFFLFHPPPLHLLCYYFNPPIPLPRIALHRSSNIIRAATAIPFVFFLLSPHLLFPSASSYFLPVPFPLPFHFLPSSSSLVLVLVLVNHPPSTFGQPPSSRLPAFRCWLRCQVRFARERPVLFGRRLHRHLQPDPTSCLSRGYRLFDSPSGIAAFQRPSRIASFVCCNFDRRWLSPSSLVTRPLAAAGPRVTSFLNSSYPCPVRYLPTPPTADDAPPQPFDQR